jgi:hypothetical protein
MRRQAEPPVRSIGTDPVAFSEFYRAHVDEVTRFVTRRVADPQLVADLTAEVFLAVIEAAASYRARSAAPGRGCSGSRATSLLPSSAGPRGSSAPRA